MDKKIILQNLAEDFVAYKFLTSVTGRVSDKIKRFYEKVGSEIYLRMKKGDRLKENSNIILNLKWDDDKARSVARQISLALEEFKQVNPKAYNQLMNIKEKHAKSRRGYLEFSGVLDNDYFYNILQNIYPEINEEQKLQIFKGIILLDELHPSSRKTLNTLLLPE